MTNKVNILKGKDLQHRFKEHKNRLHWYSAFQATYFVDDHFDPQKYNKRRAQKLKGSSKRNFNNECLSFKTDDKRKFYISVSTH